MKRKVVAFLPVKGGSERIENKNTRLMDGKPLFIHTLQKLIACEFIDEVYLDTESESIVDLASELNCKVIMRDPELATNATDGHELFYNEVRQVDADIYIQALCTSPFIYQETIKVGVEKVASGGYDSAVLLRKAKQYTWSSTPIQPKYSSARIPNSFDLEDTIIETMGLYIVNAAAAKSLKRRVGVSPFPLYAQAIEAIDVNFPDDFYLADIIASGLRERERKLLNNLAKQLSSSMLSDILDELGFDNQVIQGMRLNLDHKKVFGRAKTLKIVAADTADIDSSIYDALKSYDTVVPNDIIVVQNDVPEYAYFGELNANLALRSGAIGAIIGGKTRDSSEVRGLDFPVFSKGYTCKDIKLRGKVHSINRSVELQGIVVQFEDLIFGDNDGVVVIPREVEKKVLDRCTDVSRREKRILLNVAEGVHADKIRAEHGEF